MAVRSSPLAHSTQFWPLLAAAVLCNCGGVPDTGTVISTVGGGTDVGNTTSGGSSSLQSQGGTSGLAGAGTAGGTTTSTSAGASTGGTTSTISQGGATAFGGSTSTGGSLAHGWSLPAAASCFPGSKGLSGLQKDARYYVETALQLTTSDPVCTVSNGRQVLTIPAGTGQVVLSLNVLGSLPLADQDCLSRAGSAAELFLDVRCSHRVGTASVFTASNASCLETAVVLADSSIDLTQSLTLAKALAPTLQ